MRDEKFRKGLWYLRLENLIDDTAHEDLEWVKGVSHRDGNRQGNHIVVGICIEIRIGVLYIVGRKIGGRENGVERSDVIKGHIFSHRSN